MNHMEQAELEFIKRVVGHNDKPLTADEAEIFRAGFREAERTAASLLILHAGLKFST